MSVVKWQRPARKGAVELDAQTYTDMTNLLADLLLDRAGGRQDDHGFLLRHCGRMTLILAEVLCDNARAAAGRELDA
jgi:hypothetical protein